MKKLLIGVLILASAAFAIPQQTQRNGSFDKLNVRNTAMITGALNANGGIAGAGKFDGNCIVDGVQNATLAAAVTCAGSSGVIEIPMFAVPTLTAGVTIPAGVTLKFDGGSPGLIQLGNFNLTVNGPIQAPNAQIFSYTGSGVVTFGNLASPVSVQWFPGATADAQINNAIAAMPANGGFLDARGYGPTTQTLAATATIGSHAGSGKTITLFIDRTTTFNCTITNTTPCIQVDGGSTIMAFGAVAYPNAGLVVANGATVSQGLLVTNLFSSGLVGGFVEGMTVRAVTGATVTSAICEFSSTLQLEKVMNTSCASSGATNTVAGKITAGVGLLSTNLFLDNDQFDCQGNTGCRPVWIGCGTPTTQAACSTIYAVNFVGGLATHAGTGLPIFTIEASNGAAGTNLIDSVTLVGYQIECKSGDATQDGLLIDGPSSVLVSGLSATTAGGCGRDIVRLQNTAGVTTDGVVLDKISLQSSGWINILNNTIISSAFGVATPRMNYRYNKSGATFSNMFQDGAGNGVQIDQKGLSVTGFNISGGGAQHLLMSNAAPTISPATGFNTGTVTRNNGTSSFVITVGAVGAVSTGVLSLPTAAAGWNCHLYNQTRAAFISQSGNTNNSVTFTNYGTTFVATNWTNGDVLVGGCGEGAN